MKKLIFAAMVMAVIAVIANAQAVQYSFTYDFGADGIAVVDVDLGDVAWDPTGGPIIKVFDTDPATPGGILHLHETFHVGGNVPFTDWDEQLMVWDPLIAGWVVSSPTDKLEWGTGSNGAAAPTANQPGNWSLDPLTDLLVFDFVPPVVPSTLVTIDKEILVPDGFGRFAVFEWPTVAIPEPTIGLAGLGMLALIRRKK